jgi:hypothetical protein
VMWHSDSMGLELSHRSVKRRSRRFSRRKLIVGGNWKPDGKRNLLQVPERGRNNIHWMKKCDTRSTNAVCYWFRASFGPSSARKIYVQLRWVNIFGNQFTVT